MELNDYIQIVCPKCKALLLRKSVLMHGTAVIAAKKL